MCIRDREIAACDAVIVAADREVDLTRFDGKRLLRVPVSDGIHRAEELLREAERAPVYRCVVQTAAAVENPSLGRRI